MANNMSEQQSEIIEFGVDSCKLSESPIVERRIAHIQFSNYLWSIHVKYGQITPGSSKKKRKMVKTDNEIFIKIEPPFLEDDSAEISVCEPPSEEFQCFKIEGPPGESDRYGPYFIEKWRDPNVLMIPLTFRIKKAYGVKKTLSAIFLNYTTQFLKNPAMSDVTLCARGQEIPAHKMMLSAVSPVFKAMFNSKFSEASFNVVQIEDFGDDTISDMLKFIYTYEVPKFHTPHHTALLYAVSNKYDIEHLKNFCRTELLAKLRAENVLDILALAHTCSDDVLKQGALESIFKNCPSLKALPQYEEIMQQHPGLQKDISAHKSKRSREIETELSKLLRDSDF